MQAALQNKKRPPVSRAAKFVDICRLWPIYMGLTRNSLIVPRGAREHWRLGFVAQQLHFAIFAGIRRAASLLRSLMPYDVQSLFWVVSIHYGEQLNSRECIDVAVTACESSRDLLVIINFRRLFRQIV
jgi:hypothetical protein